EKVGQTDEAIALYEANLRDEFSGTHPYERLRILYAERKDWDNAVRVCLAAMHALGTSEKIQRFSEWAISFTSCVRWVTPLGGFCAGQDSAQLQFGQRVVLEKS